jgi:predicted transcriptional regulator
VDTKNMSVDEITTVFWRLVNDLKAADIARNGEISPSMLSRIKYGTRKISVKKMIKVLEKY